MWLRWAGGGGLDRNMHTAAWLTAIEREKRQKGGDFGCNVITRLASFAAGEGKTSFC